MNQAPTTKGSDDLLLGAYEDVAYVGRPNGMSHPDRLATIATLLGMDPAPPGSCRVLEVACGDGANLIPLASALPGASFTGFDFAPTGIARAQRMAAELGLSNARFLTLDMRAVPSDFGEFDYIIAHGFYSWVPVEVRNLLLPFISRHLAPRGVAFVSYNVYPGCHIRRAIWEMLRYHTRNVKDARAKLVAARSLIELLSDPAFTHKESDALLRRELEEMRSFSDSALFHDDLSEPNIPVYFHEFVAEVERAGLMYLAEAELHTMVGLGITPRVRQALGNMDRLTREQYLDFVHFRRFRQSLVCHAGALSRFVVDPGRLGTMHVSASRPLLEKARKGESAGADDDASARALHKLVVARWPRSIPYADLAVALASALRAEGGDPAAAPSTANAVIHAYGTGMIDLHLQPPVVAAEPGRCPTALPWARWQAVHGTVITNAYHEPIDLDNRVLRRLLALLDGTRSREQLLAASAPDFGGAQGASLLDEALARLALAALLLG